MSTIRNRLAELGWILPPPLPSVGVRLPFEFVSIRGDRAIFSGHMAQNPDGSVAHPLGKLGAELDVDAGYQAARLTALSVIASLERKLGDLDRITSWNRVFGMVNSAPGFSAQPAVINGFSDTVIEVFGPEIGLHSRSAVGMAELPFNIAVEVEGEVGIR